MKNKITLNYYDGSEGSEYDIYSDGKITVYITSNGELDSAVDVDLESLGCDTIEQLVVQLLNDGYKLNL